MGWTKLFSFACCASVIFGCDGESGQNTSPPTRQVDSSPTQEMLLKHAVYGDLLLTIGPHPEIGAAILSNERPEVANYLQRVVTDATIPLRSSEHLTWKDEDPFDDVTGKRALLVGCVIIEKPDDLNATVEASWSLGTWSGMIYEYRLARRDGHWKVVEKKPVAIS